MILSDTNDITLVDTNGEFVLDASDPPARAIADLFEFLPSWAREPVAPIRDAMLGAARSIAQLTWARIGQSAARLTSPRFAEGTWLDAWGELKKLPRRYDESDGAYRSRLLATVDSITPAAVGAAVANTAAAFTTLPVVVLEPGIDAAFAAPLGCAWNAFAQPASERLWGDDPDRQGATWGAYVFDSVVSPRLVVIVTEGAGSADPIAWSTALATAMTADDTSFAAPAGTAYAFAFVRTDSLFDLLVATVESLRAAGVAFTLFTDSALALMR